MNKNLDSFFKLVSNEESRFLEKLQWVRDNEFWLDNSFEISITILIFLRENKMEQEILEELCGFKLDLHGKHDWKLSEIKKLELMINKKLI